MSSARQGAEIEWINPLLFPPSGTFAARVRFRGLDDGSQGQASIKAFFTYYEAGCSHMEHDFELLTGTSAAYTDLWLAGLFTPSSTTDPYLSTTTHFRTPNNDQTTCGTGASSEPATNDEGTLAWNTLNTWRTYGSDGNNTVEVTLVITVTPVAVRKNGQIGYYTEYWATRDGNDAIPFGSTITWHDRTITSIKPLFHLWWLDATRSTAMTAPPYPIASMQYLDVLWFYWSKNILGYWDAHTIGTACKDGAITGTTCPAQ